MKTQGTIIKFKEQASFYKKLKQTKGLRWLRSNYWATIGPLTPESYYTDLRGSIRYYRVVQCIVSILALVGYYCVFGWIMSETLPGRPSGAMGLWLCSLGIFGTLFPIAVTLETNSGFNRLIDIWLSTKWFTSRFEADVTWLAENLDGFDGVLTKLASNGAELNSDKAPGHVVEKCEKYLVNMAKEVIEGEAGSEWKCKRQHVKNSLELMIRCNVFSSGIDPRKFYQKAERLIAVEKRAKEATTSKVLV